MSTATTATYEPRGGARELFESRAPEVLMCGPSGTGKTRAALEKIHALCELHAGVRVLLARKTRRSLTESAMVTLERHVLPPNSPVASGADRSNRSRYVFPNGSEIVCGGLDDISRVLSTEYDLIFVNEATELTLDEWETLLTRLRHGVLRDRATGRVWQQAIADANPSHPAHWLKARGDAGKMQYIDSRHDDNPSLDAAYMQRLSALTGHRRARLFEGRWAAAEGMVYDGWDESLHVIDALPLPESWPRIRAIDFGFRDAFVCLWAALSPNGRIVVYRQWIRTETLVEDHAAIVRGYSDDEPIVGTVCDHAAQERAVLERCGIRTTPARKDVLVGIQEVQARLRQRPDGNPGLVVFRDSVVERDSRMAAAGKPIGIAEEAVSYVWADPRPGGLLREVPRDGNDHALDALRYLCMAVRLVEHVRSLPRGRVIMMRPRAMLPRGARVRDHIKVF